MNALQTQKNTDTGLFILRCTLAILILFHGIANMSSNYVFIKSVLSGFGLPELIAYGVFVGEIVAPILILIGYRARLASLVLSFNMLIAILLSHSGDIFSLNPFGAWAIELQLFYLLCPIAIFFMGAGKNAVSKSSHWD